MSFQNELSEAVQSAASNPKVMTVVSGATTALGAAGITDMLRGPLFLVATCAGIAATALLGRVHWATYKNQILQTKILRRQLADLGVDPDAGD